MSDHIAGSCLIIAGSCLMAACSCLMDAGSRLVVVSSCLMAAGSCLTAATLCLIATNSCLVVAGSCLIIASSCLIIIGSCLIIAGNLYRKGASASSLAIAARGAIDLFDGFCRLRTLPVPIVCAAHGAVLGGGLAICLLTNFVTCDDGAAFQVRRLSLRCMLMPLHHLSLRVAV